MILISIWLHGIWPNNQWKFLVSLMKALLGKWLWRFLVVKVSLVVLTVAIVKRLVISILNGLESNGTSFWFVLLSRWIVGILSFLLYVYCGDGFTWCYFILYRIYMKFTFLEIGLLPWQLVKNIILG